MIVSRIFGSRFFISTVFLIAFVLECTSLLAQKSESFQIKLEAVGLKIPAKVILTLREASQWKEFSSESRHGKFFLTGHIKDPSFAYLVLKYGTALNQSPRPGNILELFVDGLPKSIVMTDSLRSAKVQGGSNQNHWEAYQKISSQLKQAPDSTRAKEVGKFIQDYLNSFVSIFAIQNFAMNGNFIPNEEYSVTLFGLLSHELQNSQSGQTLLEDIRIAKQTAIGATTPDFLQRDTLDREVKLSSFRGKYVLIDFWASWCKPCRAENPSLVKVFEQFNNNNFTILSVSLDNTKSSWLKAIRKDKLTWTHVSDLKFWRNEVALQFGIKSIPQNILINPDGKIIRKNIAPSELEAVLKSILP